MPAEKPPVLPVAISSEGECSHRQPCISRNTVINCWGDASITRLAIICLIGFATDLSGTLLLFPIPEPTTIVELDTHFHHLAYTALPFSLGAILAAACIDPILRHSRICRLYTLFFIPPSLLIGTGHGVLLLLPMFRLPRDLSAALIATAHLLLGVGNAVNLATAMLLSWGSTPLLGLIRVMAAMGVVTQTCISLHLDVGTRHLTALLLALASGCSALFLSQATGRTPAAGYEAAEETVDEMVRPRVKRGQGGFPPPASRLTVLGALFAFAYHAATVVVPVWLVSLTGGEPSSSTGQMPLVYAVFTFWAGIGVGSLPLIPSVERSKQLVSSALVISAGLLLLAWLLGDDFWNAAAPVGFFMGSAYPWMVALLMREMSEEEKVSGIAIVVAFGTSGTVTALFTTQLAAHMVSPAVLHWAVIVFFGGMLVCWNAMSGARTRPELMEPN